MTPEQVGKLVRDSERTPDGIISIDTLVSNIAAESQRELAQAREKAVEECCNAVCLNCGRPDTHFSAERNHEGLWKHKCKSPHDGYSATCYAWEIRDKEELRRALAPPSGGGRGE